MPSRPPTTDPRRARTRTAVLVTTALVLIAIVVAAVWVGTRSGREDTSGGSTAEAVRHVHGLGVDPADGMLYAATHNGLFRLPQNGAPERVSDLQQDTMGFTVAGPGHFLGSGHPDPGIAGAPANLGLIESTDSGRSWHPLSLSGQVDFHGLEAKHGQLFGYSSTTGELMVSADRRSWERRASVPLADFTVNPASPTELLATTEQGPMRSTDGGRTFAPIPGAPLLYLLDWAAPGQLYSIDPQGRAYVSSDGGTTWEPRGQLDSTPQAMTVDGDRWYVATENAVMMSTDGGRTFQPRTSLG